MAFVTVTDNVTEASLQAVNDQQFVINVGTIFYLTQAVWVYDPNNLDESGDGQADPGDQAQGCKDISSFFTSAGQYLIATAVPSPPASGSLAEEIQAAGTATSPPKAPIS